MDSYILRHGAEWDRLAELTAKRTDLTGAEADEVVDLYQRVSTHLSVVRSTASDPVLEARLSALVASARSLVTGVTLPVWQTIGHFFTTGFPAAVYRARYWWITVGVVNVLVAFGSAGGWSTLRDWASRCCPTKRSSSSSSTTSPTTTPRTRPPTSPSRSG